MRPTLAVVLAATSTATICVLFGVWLELFRAVGSGERIVTSEWRIVLATSIAAIVSLVSTIVTVYNHSRSFRLETLKKSIDISTEAAFDMWKSCTGAYRLLAKADENNFQKRDLDEISLLFQNSERTTLLLDDEKLNKFQLLWQESERVGHELQSSSGNTKAQCEIWNDEIGEYTTKYKEMRDLLRETLLQRAI